MRATPSRISVRWTWTFEATGVESFSSNSLLETAKVQNTTGDMIATLREIQSHGFVIVAGLIFGFDSDTEASFTRTLDGMLEVGLISGDPSLLTALPGTPLYRRMQLSGRLRNNKNSLGGYKYCTNIRYLMPREQLVRAAPGRHLVLDYETFCARPAELIGWVHEAYAACGILLQRLPGERPPSFEASRLPSARRAELEARSAPIVARLASE